jgi:RNA polymerase sigma factor (sigma-70 family)
MWSRPESDEALIHRMLPSTNSDRADRARAWTEWQHGIGEAALLKFIRWVNNTGEPDEDILQETMLAAFQEVERGRYERRSGIPFTAYVKGIARNKIRALSRRTRLLERRWANLDEPGWLVEDGANRQLETSIERRELVDRLRLGLLDLPEQRRQVLERFLFGETTAEIAAGLAISEALVRQHKCRGLRALRRTEMAG